MNHMTYLMRDQVRDLVPSLGVSPLYRRKTRKGNRIRAFLEIGAFLLALLSYLGALALMT